MWTILDQTKIKLKRKKKSFSNLDSFLVDKTEISSKS